MSEENNAPQKQETGTVEDTRTPFEKAVAHLETQRDLGESQETASEEAQEEVGEVETEEIVDESQHEESVSEEPTLKARQLALLERKEREYREKLAKVEQDAQQKAETYFRTLIQEARQNPEILEKYGVKDLDIFAGELWNYSMGENAPDDFKETLERRKLEARLRALEGQRQQVQQQNPQVTAQMQQIAGEMRGFVQAIPDDMPLLRAEYSENPEDTLRAFGQVGDRWISEGRYPTAREVAKEIETEMRKVVESRAAALGYTKASRQEPPGAKQPKKALSDADLKQKVNRKPNGLPGREEAFQRGLEVLRKAGMKG